MKKRNTRYVNNTNADIRNVMPVFQAAYETGTLHEDFEDIFKIEILKGCNPDGSDCMLIDWA